MDTRPLVSVIIPAFNAQDLIAETIDSVLAQSYESLEIVVVDDGSTDHTSHVVRGYGSRVRYYYQPNSGGCAVPRNTGITHSSGDLICFMDADDLMVPERTALSVDFMGRHRHVGLVFCDYRNFTEAGSYPVSHFQTCPRLWPRLAGKSETILDRACALLAKENFACTGTLMMRRSLLAFEPGFEPSLRACEDYHLYYRLARHSAIGIVNSVGLMRRLHGGNMSGDPARMLSEGIRCRTMLRDSEEDPATRAQLNRYIANCHGSLARHAADQRRFLQALRASCQAFAEDPCWTRFMATCKGLARSGVMALGFRRSRKTDE